MPTTTDIHCENDSARRAQVVASATLNGIDYIEVFGDTLDTQRFLHVYFIKPPPTGIEADTEAFSVKGGTRITNIRVETVTLDPAGGEPHLVVEVDQPGDFSTYTLAIDRPQLDDAYKACDFSFKAACPSRFDCKPKPRLDVDEQPPPVIDYMAKDYASFRQALVDLIPSLAPQWQERLAGDFGMTMLELLAYAADQLSYYQDAVANEAFLATARQRLSVRRHAALVDYHLHDGISARTFVHFEMESGVSMSWDAATPLEMMTKIAVPLRSKAPAHDVVLDDALATDARRAAAAVFETMTGGRLDARLNTIPIHDLGNRPCCLDIGATSAVLEGALDDILFPGDFLLFEEIMDPETGDEGLADLNHRQVVRLLEVTAQRDELLNIDLTRVEWHASDALTFSLCVSAVNKDGLALDDVSVARGNLLLADHGRRLKDDDRSADPLASGVRAPRFRLEHGPLSFREQPPAGNKWAVAELFAADVDPARLEPRVELELKPAPDAGEAEVRQGSSDVFSASCDAAGDNGGWTPVISLLNSDRFDRHFAVETDNDGRALLRFGDGEFGERPPTTASFEATYRIGVGRSGNIGAEALHHVLDPVSPSLTNSVAAVRNPLPAWGGRDPEPIARVKELAPAAFRASQSRAVTEADYAEVAERHPSVSRAVARFRWTGSWHTVFISIDPEGGIWLDTGLASEVEDFVAGFTQTGYDLEVRKPRYVPLTIELEICVAPDHFPPDVEEAVRDALTGTGGLGSPAFFHPDKFTFGQRLYLSALLAAVEAVEGVESVVAIRFARLDDHDPTPAFPVSRANADQGFIEVAGLEIVRLDDDPNFPGFGQLRLQLLGGRSVGLGAGTGGSG